MGPFGEKYIEIETVGREFGVVPKTFFTGHALYFGYKCKKAPFNATIASEKT